MMQRRMSLWGVLLIVSGMSALSQSISMDGPWEFAVDSLREYQIDRLPRIGVWKSIQVPGSWQAQCEDLRDYQGVAWYRKQVVLPRLKQEQTMLIQFDAVDYQAKVFVNGKFAGEHEGGYLPFSIDIRPLVSAGTNTIVVRVMDPAVIEEGTEGVSALNIPHGKQNWYVQNSGIWQSARISVKPVHHIQRVQLTPSMDGTVFVAISLRSSGKKSKETLLLRILSPSGHEVAREFIIPRNDSVQVRMTVRNPVLWRLDSPQLYRMIVSYGADHVEERFGFRSFESANGRLLLNGEPFYLIGALDQDFYPETMYTTPSEEFLRDEMLKAKQLGLNLLRCHIKVPDPRYLKVADEIGLLIWYEIPNWDVLTPDAMRRAEQTFTGMLERDWNHPSLVIVSIINESWGIDLQKADQRAWLITMFDKAKRIAAGRLVVDNSACWGNFHMKSDINDYHTYWAMPENTSQYNRTIKDFVARPAWLFSPFGDAQQSGSEPLILSEFGNWGLPKLPSSIPWWFARKFGDADVVLPAGVQDRFNLYGYQKVFGSYDGLAVASQTMQANALKYEIEELRLHPEIQGYVVTEFTDINWESNGLMDMWRNPKVLSTHLPDIQQQDVVILRPEQTTYHPGDTIVIRTWFSKYRSRPANGARLRWEVSDGPRGEFAIPDQGVATVTELSRIVITAPASSSMRTSKIRVEVVSTDGSVIAKNAADVCIIPETTPTVSQPFSVYDPTGTLRSLPELTGRFAASGSDTLSPVITNMLDEHVARLLHEGRTVLCFADTSTTLRFSAPFKIKRREGSWYDGNWASGLHWFRKDNPVFDGYPSENFLGFESAKFIPRVVLTDIKPENYADVLAGMFIGWVHATSASLVRMKAGNGTLIVCSLPIPECLASDPLAMHIFQRLKRFLADPGIRTEWNWKLSEIH
jgi:hypothetical protein